MHHPRAVSVRICSRLCLELAKPRARVIGAGPVDSNPSGRPGVRRFGDPYLITPQRNAGREGPKARNGGKHDGPADDSQKPGTAHRKRGAEGAGRGRSCGSPKFAPLTPAPLRS